MYTRIDKALTEFNIINERDTEEIFINTVDNIKPLK